MGLQQSETIVFCDRQSAIQLDKNLMYCERIKHIDIRYYFLQEVATHGGITVKKIATSENPMDVRVDCFKVQALFGLDSYL